MQNMSWLHTTTLRQTLIRSNGNANDPNMIADIHNDIASNNIHAANCTIMGEHTIETAANCDPKACFDSFRKHWQQAYEIILKVENNTYKTPTHDDVLGVVSHLDFMITLLLVELHHCNKESSETNTTSLVTYAPCLEHMLSENLLDKLYEWSCTTGRFNNAVRLEQLKLYELLVSHSRYQLLSHEPFLRPLLKILTSSQDEIFPPDIEKRLVLLLNQLCVVLMQNVHLLDLFFFSTAQQETQTKANFIIFSLLIPYVHSEGSVGHQARDALLLCMSLSQKNSNVGTYIAKHSSICSLLVTGLGGLYSRLPNSIEMSIVEWHRITADDVTDVMELTLFMNALEFCNAVIQVAHEMIKNQLLDFMYQGFIVPVLGPALLQTNIDSQISAMSYFELILRSVTEPDLLKWFIAFLLDSKKFDGVRILDVLLKRLTSPDSNLCMVAMALFDTILSLNCEDIVYEMILKYLLPAKYVPISYRHKINQINPYVDAADVFRDLTPNVMKRARELTKHKNVGDTVNHTHPTILSSTSNTMSKTIGANWNYYCLHSGDSLYANYYAYLCDARIRIKQSFNACSAWSSWYKYQKHSQKHSATNHSEQALEMFKQFLMDFDNSTRLKEQPPQTATTSNVAINQSIANDDDKKQLDSLQSLGESSGYESFKWRSTDEDGLNDDGANSTPVPVIFDNINMDSNNKTIIKKEPWRVSCYRNDVHLTDLDLSEDLFAQGTISLGPFINALWGKLQTFTSNSLFVNLHLTGLITRLACYPLPLIHSILLRPDIIITCDTPSFHQILHILKQQIDAELPVIEDSLEAIDVARCYLIDREFRSIKIRQQSLNAYSSQNKSKTTSTPGPISATSTAQLATSSSYDSFRRNDINRKSISKSLTTMFNRKRSNVASGFSQLYAFITGNGISSSTTSLSSTSTASNNFKSTVTTPATRTSSFTNTKRTPNDIKNTYKRQIISRMPSTSSNVSDSNGFIQSQRYSQQSHNNNNNNIKILNSFTATQKEDDNAYKTLNGRHTQSTTAQNSNSEEVDLSCLSSEMGAFVRGNTASERTHDLALCAVILDEWLKELAAISQEQSVVMINIGH